jgi:GrpB-like predicted nucleotidyltransferase (UPF0157 family)
VGDGDDDQGDAEVQPVARSAGAYGDLKRTLAARLGTDRAGYTEAKSAYIERVLAASPQRP